MVPFHLIFFSAHLCQVCKQKRFATSSNLFRHSRSCRGPKSDFIAVSYPGESFINGLDWRISGDPNDADPSGRDRALELSSKQQEKPGRTPSPIESLPSASDVDHRVNEARPSYSSSSSSSSSYQPSPTMFTPFQQIEPFDDSAGSLSDGPFGESENAESRAPPLFSAKRPRHSSPALPPMEPSRRLTSPPRNAQASYAPRRDRSRSYDDPEPTFRNLQVDKPSAARQTSASTEYWSAQPLITHVSHSTVPPEYQTIFTVKTEDAPAPSYPAPAPHSSRSPAQAYGVHTSSKGLKWADEAKKTRRTAPLQQTASTTLT